MLRCNAAYAIPYTFGITKGQNAGYSGKDVHNMISDEELYRQYLSGDETGLEELMRKYDNPLTLYINGYLHDVHEAEDLMIEVFSYLFAKRPISGMADSGLTCIKLRDIWLCAIKASGDITSVLMI